jgi:hypothetical protein
VGELSDKFRGLDILGEVRIVDTDFRGELRNRLITKEGEGADDYLAISQDLFGRSRIVQINRMGLTPRKVVGYELRPLQIKIADLHVISARCREESGYRLTDPS